MPTPPPNSDVTVQDGPLGSFGIKISFAGDTALLGVSGEVDLVSAPELGGVLDALIDQGQASVVLDLADLEFMGAAGLGILAVRAGRIARLGGEFTIRPPSSALVVRLLDLTGLVAVVQLQRSDSPHQLGPEQSESGPGVPVRSGPPPI